MRGRQSDIPVAVAVVQSGTEVQSVAVNLRRRQCRVARLARLCLRAVEALAEQSRVYAGAYRAAEQVVLVGVLQRDALV